MTAIAVGNAAISRTQGNASGYTNLDLGVPADGSGTIDTISVYLNTTMTAFKVGMFYLSSGTTYVCRSSYTASGFFGAGLHTFTGLSLDVVVGDVIGMYYSSGSLYRDASGGSSAYVSGDHASVGNSASYTTSTRIFSLHGDGETVAVGSNIPVIMHHLRQQGVA